MAFCLAILAGCAQAPGKVQKNVQKQEYQVTCIAVLPAVPVADVSRKITPEQQNTLQRGAKVLNGFFARELGKQANVTLVSEELLSGLEMSGGENTLDIARLVGRTVQCNAVLETTVSRYRDRIGSKWSVEQAAAVAFAMRLIGTDDGKVLWSAQFDEEQIPVMENLYNWNKAKTRGFTWITAEQLMEEGIREKLSKCPYLSEENENNSLENLENKV
jgi:hypothetical protein